MVGSSGWGGLAMPRGDQLTRQWRLLHILASRGGRTIPELMREVGCSRRTIWRDLGILQAVGFPLTAERSPVKR